MTRFRRYYASFVICEGSIERTAIGEQLTHAQLAKRMPAQTASRTSRPFVSGAVFTQGERALAEVGPLVDGSTQQQVDALIREAFGSLKQLEIHHSDI